MMTKLIKERKNYIISEISLNLIQSISFNSKNLRPKPKEKFGMRL